MQSNRKRLLLLLLHVVVVGFAVSSAAMAQNVADWTVQAPPSTVQLVGVKAVSAGGLRFNFKNVLKKTIVEFKVASPEFNGSSTERGVDAFTTGIGEVKPGGTMSVNFDEKDFSSGNQTDRTLRVEAVVYTDGSYVGSKKELDSIEDEMLGAALETERVANLLATSREIIFGPNSYPEEKVGKPLASPTVEEAAAVRGIVLPGISQSYIDARINRPASRVAFGVNLARASLLADMENKKKQVTMPSTVPQMRDDSPGDPATELAQKYSTLAKKQVHIISGFITASSAP